MLIRLQLADAQIVAQVCGEGAPLLMLHGFPATRQLWDPMVEILIARGYRCIVPDLVGYGESEAHEGVRVDMASQARWLWQLLDELNLERLVLVAHDVGSAAAQLMAAQAPRRTRALVVVDGVHETEWAMHAIASIRDWPPGEAARLQPVLLRRLGKSPPLRALLARYEGERGGQQLIRAARDLEPRQTAGITARLREAGTNALVLWGRDDPYLPLESVARPLAAQLDAPLQVLPGGHFTPLDCPQEVVAQLCSFLDSLA
jgi:pimeloyl-ACP methyl ester carboxylesterase